MSGSGNPESRTCQAVAMPPQDENAGEPSIFDEQLWLLGSRSGEPAANVPYSILLGDGSKRMGVTDEEGRTERIVTQRPTSLVSLTLTPPHMASEAACCGSLFGDDQGTDTLYINGQGNGIAATNDNQVGTSKVKVPVPEGSERNLAAEEMAMARAVFGDGVDYAKVKVHHGGWWLFMGKQDPTTAATPHGDMYFSTGFYRENFAASDDRGRELFMHAMVHVWQHQIGYAVKRNAPTVTSHGKSASRYSLTPTSRLSDFNMEQQGDIMSDYYMICILKRPARGYSLPPSSELLHNVMAPFVNPRDKSHLPK